MLINPFFQARQCPVSCWAWSKMVRLAFFSSPTFLDMHHCMRQSLARGSRCSTVVLGILPGISWTSSHVVPSQESRHVPANPPVCSFKSLPFHSNRPTFVRVRNQSLGSHSNFLPLFPSIPMKGRLSFKFKHAFKCWRSHSNGAVGIFSTPFIPFKLPLMRSLLHFSTSSKHFEWSRSAQHSAPFNAH